MKRFIAVMFCSALSVAAGPAATHHLKATPHTVAWGYFAAATPPVMHIHSGDTVEVETLITNSPSRLEEAGIPASQVQQSLRDIYREVTDKGPGGHIHTGPIYIEEAEPGNVIEVRIRAHQTTEGQFRHILFEVDYFLGSIRETALHEHPPLLLGGC